MNNRLNTTIDFMSKDARVTIEPGFKLCVKDSAGEHTWDLSVDKRYYAKDLPVDLTEAIDEILYKEHLVRVLHWKEDTMCFTGTDGLQYEVYEEFDGSTYLVETHAAEQWLLIKEVYYNEQGMGIAYLTLSNR